MAKKVGGTDDGKPDDRVTFDAKQQEKVNQLVGDARVQAREKAQTDFEASLEDDQRALLEAAREEARVEAKADFEAATAAEALKAAEEAETARLKAEKEWETLVAKQETRIQELEPLVAKVEALEKIVTDMLGTRTEALGEAAKTAIEALPEGLTDLQKLNWLNQNEALFATKPVGTPKPGATPTPGATRGTADKGTRRQVPKRF